SAASCLQWYPGSWIASSRSVVVERLGLVATAAFGVQFTLGILAGRVIGILGAVLAVCLRRTAQRFTALLCNVQVALGLRNRGVVTRFGPVLDRITAIIRIGRGRRHGGFG